MSIDLDSFLLTRRELQIMNVVWDKETATVKEVHEVLTQAQSISRNTILTMIRILEHKGALTHRRFGRSYIYLPLLSRHQATRNQIRDVVARFFDGRPEKLIENVIKNEIKGPEQLGMAKTLVESRLMPVMVAELLTPQPAIATP
jgi:predicted transcriptional regulator